MSCLHPGRARGAQRVLRAGISDLGSRLGGSADTMNHRTQKPGQKKARSQPQGLESRVSSHRVERSGIRTVAFP